ncbi:hypothetical protein SEA_ASHERTHEMAN_60 [Gordonia phage Ashertheman]|uniref:Uncharacterized protein n=1 Tax=Gordonia phage Ashertheman TaxID=2301692 RepID=A0A385DW69_9CAUD|nr:hypothetical protein J1764_gp60 [Gordonia phage Ashertheman]AXQ62967.1 hypothetical protein SEA_ASHERTHEMAN_60 [Gordonia phage Ashertheman]
MRQQQNCPQCSAIITVNAVDALLCPACGAIAVVTAQGLLAVPDVEQLDLILLRPEVRRLIEQASAIRQALFGGQFTLADPTGLLDPEPHSTLAQAIARAQTAPWPITTWVIIDPSGHVAAHRTARKGQTA